MFQNWAQYWFPALLILIIILKLFTDIKVGKYLFLAFLAFIAYLSIVTIHYPQKVFNKEVEVRVAFDKVGLAGREIWGKAIFEAVTYGDLYKEYQNAPLADRSALKNAAHQLSDALRLVPKLETGMNVVCIGGDKSRTYNRSFGKKLNAARFRQIQTNGQKLPLEHVWGISMLLRVKRKHNCSDEEWKRVLDHAMGKQANTFVNIINYLTHFSLMDNNAYVEKELYLIVNFD